MTEQATKGLPSDLASVLRDQSVIVAQDTSVFETIAAWARAPSSTMSANVSLSLDTSLVDALYRQSQVAETTTVAVG